LVYGNLRFLLRLGNKHWQVEKVLVGVVGIFRLFKSLLCSGLFRKKKFKDLSFGP